MHEYPFIPDFSIEGPCGAGASGDVWLARDKSGIRRAVKAIDKLRLARQGILRREEKAVTIYRAAEIRHPNLIEIFHVGETEKVIYYVMPVADNLDGTASEYIADTLAARIALNGSMHPAEVITLAGKMLAALELLHSKELMHRDIKPSNIIYIDGEPKLADIGLVASAGTEISLLGTPGFIPPEGWLDTSSDFYSLGKTLYCAFTGNQPGAFPELSPAALNHSGTREFTIVNNLILKACDRDPKQRFKTVAEFDFALKGGRRKFTKKVFLSIFGIAALFTGGLTLLLYGKNLSVKPLYKKLYDEALELNKSGDAKKALGKVQEALKADKTFADAQKLQHELIRERIRNEPEQPLPEQTPDKEVPGKRELTKEERKEYAILFLLYNSNMAKEKYEEAVVCIDGIYKRWPWMKNEVSLARIRANALKKAKSKESAKDNPQGTK